MSIVHLPEGSVHVREQGCGEPLLLLHANPGDSLDFSAVTTPLSGQYRVIAPDWPGFGLSPGPKRTASSASWVVLLGQLVDRLGLDGVHLVGNSIGGNIACRYAFARPEKVRSLTMVSPGGFTAHNALTRSFCRLQASRFSIPPALFASRYLRIRNVHTEAMWQRARTSQAATEQRALARTLWLDFLDPGYDLCPLVSRMPVPALLMFGEHDPVIRLANDGRNAKVHWPAARHVVLPCGHAPFAELPEVFLSELRSFLGNCVPSTSPRAEH